MELGTSKEKESRSDWLDFHWYDTIEENNQKVIAVKSIYFNQRSGASHRQPTISYSDYTDTGFSKTR